MYFNSWNNFWQNKQEPTEISILEKIPKFAWKYYPKFTELIQSKVDKFSQNYFNTLKH